MVTFAQKRSTNDFIKSCTRGDSYWIDQIFCLSSIIFYLECDWKCGEFYCILWIFIYLYEHLQICSDALIAFFNVITLILKQLNIIFVVGPLGTCHSTEWTTCCAKYWFKIMILRVMICIFIIITYKTIQKYFESTDREGLNRVSMITKP